MVDSARRRLSALRERCVPQVGGPRGRARCVASSDRALDLRNHPGEDKDSDMEVEAGWYAVRHVQFADRALGRWPPPGEGAVTVRPWRDRAMSSSSFAVAGNIDSANPGGSSLEYRYGKRSAVKLVVTVGFGAALLAANYSFVGAGARTRSDLEGSGMDGKGVSVDRPPAQQPLPAQRPHRPTVDRDRVPPHLRGYYSNMMGAGGQSRGVRQATPGTQQGQEIQVDPRQSPIVNEAMGTGRGRKDAVVASIEAPAVVGGALERQREEPAHSADFPGLALKSESRNDRITDGVMGAVEAVTERQQWERLEAPDAVEQQLARPPEEEATERQQKVERAAKMQQERQRERQATLEAKAVARRQRAQTSRQDRQAIREKRLAKESYQEDAAKQTVMETEQQQQVRLRQEEQALSIREQEQERQADEEHKDRAQGQEHQAEEDWAASPSPEQSDEALEGKVQQQRDQAPLGPLAEAGKEPSRQSNVEEELWRIEAEEEARRRSVEAEERQRFVEGEGREESGDVAFGALGELRDEITELLSLLHS